MTYDDWKENPPDEDGKPCWHCDGDGHIDYSACAHCGGTGVEEEDEEEA